MHIYRQTHVGGILSQQKELQIYRRVYASVSTVTQSGLRVSADLCLSESSLLLSGDSGWTVAVRVAGRDEFVFCKHMKPVSVCVCLCCRVN